MPPIRLLSSTIRRTYIVTVILSLGEVILLYSCCVEKGLIYVAIAAPFSRQPSFYSKCILVNIHLSYNIHSISNTKYIYIYQISL